MKNKQTIVFLGASGAVGSIALHEILSGQTPCEILSLGRRKIKLKRDYPNLKQALINIHNPVSYASLLTNVDIAICTLGVGEPSKVSKQDFVAIDKTAVVNFAIECKRCGVRHFQLLSSVGVSSRSRNFFMRTKGELIDALIELDFDQLSIFQPSMILTPTNRYGFTQAITLKVWPKLDFILQNSLRKYRGIKVELLGKAIAHNIHLQNGEIEYLQYDDFIQLQSLYEQNLLI